MTTTTGSALTLRAKLEIAAAIAALLFAFYGFHTWLAEHDARVRADAAVAAAQKQFDETGQQISALKSEDAARQAAADKQLAAIRAESAKATTPQQIAKWMPAQLALPAPISIAAPPAEPGQPTPSAIATIPEEDLAPLKDLIVQAKTCAVELPAAQQGLTSCQQQQKLAATQLADVEKQRDAYKLELKGGTFWHRVKHDAKVIGIGVAIGAAATCASGHCK